MTTRIPMFTYRNEATRRDEHVAVHRVVRFVAEPYGGTIVEIDHGDVTVSRVKSSESLSVLQDRWDRLMEATTP